MAASRAAIRYAKATLRLAVDKKVVDKVEEDMKSISATILGNKELQQVLKSPIVKAELKKASLLQIFKGSDAVTEGLINVLIENKRIAELGEVALKYITLNEQLKGKERAVVTTAFPLTESLEKQVLTKVKALTGNDVTITNKIDESIIGGFILRVGDLQYDASIANKLNTLKRSFAAESYVSQL